MDILLALAQNVNWAFHTNNKKKFTDSAFQLFNYTQGRGRLLTKMEDSGDSQMVGLAFYYNARFIKYDDIDINSVSAENAYYCLAKSIKLDNNFAAPALYNLLKYNHSLLKDRFMLPLTDSITEFVSDADKIQSRGGFQNHGVWVNAEKYLPHIRFFVISQFYDIKSGESKIPNDMPFAKVSDTDLKSDIREMLGKELNDRLMEAGKKFFELMYEDVKVVLLRF